MLAGDHLKAASGLGVPVVGVGLFYRQGYFRQELSDDGWQQERYVTMDPHGMAVHPVEGARVIVDLAGATLEAQAWRADVGRVRLYLLDADIEANAAEHRLITDRLYGGDTEHRLQQEILLGIGGVRLLEAVGEDTQVFHTNEGHAGFLGLERIRRLMADGGLAFHEAIETARAGTIFTTHTPVPAGIDRFPRSLMEKYFRSWADECGLPFDDLMALGHHPDDEYDAPFNMAVMGLRLAGRSNGVSMLHGRVSRNMFAALWPGVPVDEVPIGSITNGVHARTWVSAEMSDLFDRHVLPEWQEADESRWARIVECRDDDLWRVREQGRERLVSFVRMRTARRRGSRPARAHDRVRPPVRLVQAGHDAALPARPIAGAAARSRSAAATRVRRQGPPRGRHRQGDDPRDRAVLARRPISATASALSRTTTSPSPAPSIRAPTSG